MFRSRALVLFGPVRRVADLPGEDLAREITEVIRDDLSELLVEGSTWEERILVVRVAEMFAKDVNDTSLTHLNQIGQTGSTPRHRKGLSTCCHGEEPHVVGWRFITERRAVNLDANCGWARGKADVVYVADAFEVMRHLNGLLSA